MTQNSVGRATIHDVARAAGVSIKTVSRVVNREAHVAASTREKVLRAVAQLKYRPNPAAQGLRRAGTGSIAYVCEDISSPLSAQLALAIERAAGSDVIVIVASSLGDGDRERRILESLTARQVDGIILGPTLSHVGYLNKILGRTALICIDRPAIGYKTDVVLSDNTEGMDQATTYLLQAGHTRIAYLADDKGVYTQRERLLGYKRAIERAGIEEDEEIIYQYRPDIKRIKSHLRWMLHLGNPPTAYVSGNSLTTLSLLEAGFEPHRNSFVGFDDFPLADVINGGVDVISQNTDELGSQAVAALNERIANDESPPRTIRIPARLIIRSK